MSMVGKLFVVMSFSGIYVYTIEIYPTTMRNLGLASASIIARIGGVIAPFFGGPLVREHLLFVGCCGGRCAMI